MNSALESVLRFGVLALLGLTSGCVPTMSMHSYRNVAITITTADAGEPVPSLPFRVIYDYNPVDGPIYHVELRTPHEVRAETDENGEAVIKLADYAWGIRVEVNAKERGYSGLFWLSKDLIRKGGVVQQERYPYPDLPKLRLDLQPIKRPNPRAALDAGRASCLHAIAFCPGASEHGCSATPHTSCPSG